MVVVCGVLGDGTEVVAGKELMDFVIVVLGVDDYRRLAFISLGVLSSRFAHNARSQEHKACCIMFQSCLPCSCLLYHRKYYAFNVGFLINRISPVHVINTCIAY